MTNTTWDDLWLDCHSWTWHEASELIIREAALATQNGKIAWFGKQADLPKDYQQRAKRIHSLQGQWITPGLIDCHTHLVYAGDRADEFSQRIAGATYESIAKQGGGIHRTVQLTRAASEEQLFQQSAPRLQQMLSNGVTTVEIKSGYGLDLASELNILRVAKRLQLAFPINIIKTFLGAHVVPQEFKGQPEQYLDYLITSVLPVLVEEQLVDCVDAFCENIAFNKPQVERMFLAAKSFNLPVKLHAEQLSDQQGALLAAKYQALSADHLEYVSETSVKAMQTAGTVAVILPGAYYYLQAPQKPPLDLFRKHAVAMAIATDCNPGTSPICSLLLVMNLAAVLFRMTLSEILAGVTIHAAKALGMADTHGSLSVGKVADIAVWRVNSLSELIYYAGQTFNSATIKAGQYR